MRGRTSLYFQFIETLAEYTHNLALRDKSVRVYLFYYPKYVLTLATTCKHNENFLFLLGVPAMTVQYGYTAVKDRYCRSYVGVVSRNYEELHALSSAAQNVIERKIGDHKRAISEQQVLQVADRGKQRGGDNKKVADDRHLPDRNVSVFVYYCADDVCTSRTTALQKHYAYTQTFKQCSDDARHEALIAKKHRQVFFCKCISGKIGDDFLHESYEKAQHNDGVNGFDKKLQAQNADGCQQQHCINNKNGVLSRERSAGGVEYQCTQTGNGSSSDMIGQNKAAKAYGIT